MASQIMIRWNLLKISTSSRKKYKIIANIVIHCIIMLLISQGRTTEVEISAGNIDNSFFRQSFVILMELFQ